MDRSVDICIEMKKWDKHAEPTISISLSALLMVFAENPCLLPGEKVLDLLDTLHGYAALHGTRNATKTSEEAMRIWDERVVGLYDSAEYSKGSAE